MKATIIGVNGAQYPLNNSAGMFLLRDTSGLWHPPIDLDTVTAVGRQGSVLTRVQVQERDVSLPVMVHADSQIEARDRLRTLLSATNPTVGDSILRIEYDDGSRRDLWGRVADVAVVGGRGRATWQEAVITWRAFDPYWRIGEVVREYAVAAPDFFTDPDGFPLQLAGESIIASVMEENIGDADAWPVWMLRGPGVPVLRNLTTDEVLQFEDLVLETGQELIVNTEPGIKTIEVDGVSVYQELTLESRLWALVPGPNEVSIDLVDGTSDSLVRLRYQARALTP